MQLTSFTYTDGRGWSVPALPALDSDRTLVVAFGAPTLFDNPEPIEQLARAYPQSHLVGCSTAGEIFGDQLFDASLSVAVVRFERASIATAVAAVDPRLDSFAAGPAAARESSFAAGAQLASQLLKPSLRGVFVLSDGLAVNGSELVRGLNSVLSESVSVTGGLAGDGDRFGNTWIIKDGRPQSSFVCAVGFYGDSVLIGHGAEGGWDRFGPERTVTRSDGNVVYEFDGKPALQLYKEYLGELASGLPAMALHFPLGLRTGAAEDKPLVRTVVRVDEETQALHFAGDYPVGSLAQLMRGNLDRLIGGAGEAAEAAATAVGGAGPSLALAVSCVCRRVVLGDRTEEEIEATLDTLPAGTQQIGFYSYGQLSPYAAEGSCALHNESMALTWISELAQG